MGSDQASALAVRREGRGPEILLVHGGASPETTWRGLESLAARWTLVYVYRRGFPPSPLEPSHDFDVDAADLVPLLASHPHVVAHSYGGLGASLASSAHPDLVRSLTLIEPPIYQVAPDDPDVLRIRELGDIFMAEGLAMEPTLLHEFLTGAGSPIVPGQPLPDAVKGAVERAHGGRSPSECHVQLQCLRAAGVPVLSVSGGHSPGMERIADGLATALAGERLTAPGAGHLVAGAPGFADALATFFETIEARDGYESGTDMPRP